MDKLEHYCKKWDLQNPKPLEETPRSWLYHVQYHEKQAVIKIFKDFYGIQFEISGAEFLKHCPDKISATVFHNDDGATLLEYLPNGPLSQWVWDGKDDDATMAIANMAKTIHASNIDGQSLNFPTMREWFQGLFDFTKNDDKPHIEYFKAAAKTAQRLLDTQKQTVCLHGD